jgi:hypothetical protein
VDISTIVVHLSILFVLTVKPEEPHDYYLENIQARGREVATSVLKEDVFTVTQGWGEYKRTYTVSGGWVKNYGSSNHDYASDELDAFDNDDVRRVEEKVIAIATAERAQVLEDAKAIHAGKTLMMTIRLEHTCSKMPSRRAIDTR